PDDQRLGSGARGCGAQACQAAGLSSGRGADADKHAGVDPLGGLQALFFLAYCYVAVLAIAEGYAWVSAALSVAQIYLRLVLLNVAAFVVVSAVPIAAKWVLVGRWKAQHIRIWSLAYVRFWIVKTLIRSSPAARLFIGTPLYVLFLRALGAKIGPGVVIFSRRVPV